MNEIVEYQRPPRRKRTGIAALLTVRGTFRALVPAALCTFASNPGLVEAKPPMVQIAERQELRFGKFAVPSFGERTIGTDGSIRDTGLLPVGPSNTGPATFVLTYDRGNASKKQIVVDVLFSIQGGTYSNGRVTANLKNFTSDLPGAPNLLPGQPVSIRLSDCQSRVCSTTFRVGATMEITNATGGGEVIIPTYLDVMVEEVTR